MVCGERRIAADVTLPVVLSGKREVPNAGPLKAVACDRYMNFIPGRPVHFDVEPALHQVERTEHRKRASEAVASHADGPDVNMGRHQLLDALVQSPLRQRGKPLGFNSGSTEVCGTNVTRRVSSFEVQSATFVIRCAGANRKPGIDSICPYEQSSYVIRGPVFTAAGQQSNPMTEY